MSIIRVLPDDISNRIAAGEVIERPASIVKELVENSIDASANHIIVKIENAGKKLITVIDNGCGMDEDDAILCFEPHATSKITNIKDIDNIRTMGFRGEAMPSIASISRLKLKTRKKDCLEGFEVQIEGGRFLFSGPAGCAPGTEITIRDLFFNTPARRKFLKTDNTEEKHIIDMFCQLALAHCNISFDLIADGSKIISSPKGDNLLSRIQTFYGSTLKNALIPVNFEKSGIKVTGYAAKHGFTRKSRKEQRVYINYRPIESYAVYKGIKNGYESLVMKGCFPPVCLLIEMSPQKIDFNVHPAKREVRFREPGVISKVVESAIQDALRQTAMPTVSIAGEMPFSSIISGAEINYAPETIQQPELLNEIEINSNKIPFPKDLKPIPKVVPELNIPNSPSFTIPHSSDAPTPTASIDLIDPTDSTTPIDPIKKPLLQVLAFLDETYILASSDSGLVIIDQHAAHERVLFEKLMKRAENNQINSQKLLIPITLELSKSEIQFLKKNSDSFITFGFDVEPFGSNTIIISSFPSVLKMDNIAETFSDILSNIIENEKRGTIDKAEIAKAACKKAVKAHDNLTIDEANSLLLQMNNCILPYSCPHGRPTMISISYNELEKRFGRK
jgi:DNA mismatch repair protein MutL